MFRTSMVLAATLVAVGAGRSQAQDWAYGRSYSRPTRGYCAPVSPQYSGFYVREQQRYVDHEIAHQGPQSRYEHDRLHDVLEYERAVDAARIRNSQRVYSRPYYSSGVYFGNRRTQVYVGW